MIPGVRRVCLDCGALTSHGSRCEPCETAFQRRLNQARGDRPHYQGDYKRRAAAVRAAAEFCHICGEPARPGDPWQADHLVEGDPNSPLLPAHRSCNNAKAARVMKARRKNEQTNS